MFEKRGEVDMAIAPSNVRSKRMKVMSVERAMRPTTAEQQS